MTAFKARDTISALHDWIKKEILDGPSRLYDLGKHLFSISIGSIGLLITIAAIAQRGDKPIPELAYLAGGFFIFSAFSALWLTLPRVLRLDTRPDIMTVYSKTIRNGVASVWVWALLWMLGLIMSAFALFTPDCSSTELPFVWDDHMP